MLDVGDYYRDDLSRQTECRGKIREASNILQELVNEVLDMSKLESGKIYLEEKPFNIYQLINEVIDVVGKMADEREIKVEHKTPEIIHKDLIGSPIHLKRLLMNILSNAVKYNKDYGKIYLSSREIPSDQDGVVMLEFICQDTGIGMSEEFQKHLFEPFAQEQKGGASKFGGTGLGMPITKSLVEKMGGTITFISEQGIGTTFVITIPFKINEDVARDEEKQEEVTASIRGLNILLVEDNELNMEIAASMIRDMDFPQDKPLVRTAWEICRWHHERWDGRGYPDGLKGEEIPISAQIVSIADVYDALTSVRCYKNAYDHDTAIQMILEGQCGQFNPLLLECLKEISPQLSRTFKKEKDDNREYYEAQRISEEILRQNALPRKDHSQRVIEIMQEKIKFFKENSGKISMEYNAISGKLVLTDGESQKEYQRDLPGFDLYGAYDISEEDIQRIEDSLDTVSSENKEVSMKVMLKVRGERQMCDLKLHTLWSSLKTDGYIGIVGQLDIVE